jgi:hypothetical protein
MNDVDLMLPDNLPKPSHRAPVEAAPLGNRMHGDSTLACFLSQRPGNRTADTDADATCTQPAGEVEHVSFGAGKHIGIGKKKNIHIRLLRGYEH